MFHLDERVLEKLVTGSASGNEAAKYSRHASGCRQCSRMLEEWRDNFPEIDEIYPWLGETEGSVATVTPMGMMVSPGVSGWRLPRLDPANMLWVVALLMALLVGYGAHRMRKADAGLDLAGSVRRPPPASAGSGAGAVMPEKGATKPAAEPKSAATTPPPAPATTPRTAAPPVTRERAPAPVRTASPEPKREKPQPVRRAESLPDSDSRPTGSAPATSSGFPVSANFRRVSMSEAVLKLGGQLRLIEGLEPDHVEIGPASAVPGSQAGLDVIRVVYRSSSGGRILLDQQLIPADASGFRPLDDPALEGGETAFGSAPNGVSVGTWLDNDGYRMSLVARASVDSLRRLVPLIR
jgi:hypothetical protein